nr:hypothetical protein [Thermoanaerobaculia bacterium]
MPAVLSPPSPSRLRVPLAVAVAFLLQLAFAAALAAQAQGGSWSSVGNPPIPRSLERSPEFEWRRLRALRPLDLATSAAPGLALRETSQVLVPGIPVPLYGTDHVAAGVGLRNQARGVIALTGTPPGATLQAGFLYWGILGTIDPATAAGLYNKALLSGRSVVGQLIGWTLEPCWLGSGYFYAFRADVTDKLPPAINGNYTLELLLPASTVKDGRGSWQDPPAALVPPLADGASLVAIFSHPSLPSAARVYLHEGPVLVVGPVTLSHVLQPPLPAATFLRHTRLGADGQSQTGGAPTLPVVTSLGRLLTSVADLT